MFRSLLVLLLFNFVAQSASQSSSNFTAVFSFGDSLLDTGTNDYLPTTFKANFLPYGVDFPGQRATGRFSDGLMIPDLLSRKLHIKQFVPPFADPALAPAELRTGVNFASAGAGYDYETSLFSATTPVLEQVQKFTEYAGRLKEIAGEKEAARILEGSLVIFSSGSNDYAINFFSPVPSARRLQFTLWTYPRFLLEILQEALKKLYDQGVRKFIIAGVPPFGCMPVNIASRFIDPLQGECILEQISVATAYNSMLQDLLPRLQQSLVGSKIAYLDLHNNLLDMINNPNTYGFEVTRRGCCGSGTLEIGPLCNSFVPVCQDPSKYVFFDGVHPTQKVYGYVTKQIMEEIVPKLY